MSDLKKKPMKPRQDGESGYLERLRHSAYSRISELERLQAEVGNLERFRQEALVLLDTVWGYVASQNPGPSLGQDKTRWLVDDHKRLQAENATLTARVAELEGRLTNVIGWRENDWPEGFDRRTAELVAELAQQPTDSREGDGCIYCGMDHGYHDKACPQRDLTHLADAPSVNGDGTSLPDSEGRAS